MKVEASKSEDEFFNTKEHMYTAVNKEKRNNAGGEWALQQQLYT